MSDGAADEAAIVALVEAIGRSRPDIDPLAGILLAARHHGLAADSRSLAKTLDIAHAHALRALTSVEESGLVAVARRDARTQRSHYDLTAAGRRLIAAATAATADPS